MQLSPRYGADPIIVLDGEPEAIVAPLVRQRRRLADVVGGFGAEQWQAPTRCEGWVAKDVVSHLNVTNGFWLASVLGALAGEPTRILEGFDPKATPAAMAEADAASSVDDVRQQFVATTRDLCDAAEGLTAEQLTLTGEAPPGHVALSAVLHHALWDSWIHERDILLPTGVEPEVHDDEVACSLRYVASLSPALALTRDPGRRGRFAIAATDPDQYFVVEADGHVTVRHDEPSGMAGLVGDAADLVDALSVRAPMPSRLLPDDQWMVDGLAEVFEEL